MVGTFGQQVAEQQQQGQTGFSRTQRKLLNKTTTGTQLTQEQYYAQQYQQAYSEAKGNLSNRISEQNQAIQNINNAIQEQLNMLNNEHDRDARNGIYDTLRQLGREKDVANAQLSALKGQESLSQDDLINSYYSGGLDRVQNQARQEVTQQQHNEDYPERQEPQQGIKINDVYYPSNWTAGKILEAQRNPNKVYVSKMGDYYAPTPKVAVRGEKQIVNAMGDIVGVESEYFQKSMKIEDYNKEVERLQKVMPQSATYNPFSSELKSSEGYNYYDSKKVKSDFNVLITPQGDIIKDPEKYIRENKIPVSTSTENPPIIKVVNGKVLIQNPSYYGKIKPSLTMEYYKSQGIDPNLMNGAVSPVFSPKDVALYTGGSDIKGGLSASDITSFAFPVKALLSRGVLNAIRVASAPLVVEGANKVYDLFPTPSTWMGRGGKAFLGGLAMSRSPTLAVAYATEIGKSFVYTPIKTTGLYGEAIAQDPATFFGFVIGGSVGGMYKTRLERATITPKGKLKVVIESVSDVSQKTKNIPKLKAIKTLDAKLPKVKLIKGGQVDITEPINLRTKTVITSFKDPSFHLVELANKGTLSGRMIKTVGWLKPTKFVTEFKSLGKNLMEYNVYKNGKLMKTFRSPIKDSFGLAEALRTKNLKVTQTVVSTKENPILNKQGIKMYEDKTKVRTIVQNKLYTQEIVKLDKGGYEIQELSPQIKTLISRKRGIVVEPARKTLNLREINLITKDNKMGKAIIQRKIPKFSKINPPDIETEILKMVDINTKLAQSRTIGQETPKFRETSVTKLKAKGGFILERKSVLKDYLQNFLSRKKGSLQQLEVQKQNPLLDTLKSEVNVPQFKMFNNLNQGLIFQLPKVSSFSETSLIGATRLKVNQQTKTELKNQLKTQQKLNNLTKIDQILKTKVITETKLAEQLKTNQLINLIEFPKLKVTPTPRNVPIIPRIPRIEYPKFEGGTLVETIKKIKKKKKKKIFSIGALFPDFTARSLGLKPKEFGGVEDAMKEIRRIKTGFEVRTGGRIKGWKEQDIMKGILK